ncbi:large ribosomal subunit protein mL44 [Trichomonascus vanleenenianus]|uniref:mitochondrial 54S ribosomal protein mL44 MRPL3 n=1 Tax=Trichomonascus vanleenenianus TaxID=2268995 RepID=UPI003ECAEA20
MLRTRAVAIARASRSRAGGVVRPLSVSAPLNKAESGYTVPTKVTEFGEYARKEYTQRLPIEEAVASRSPSVVTLHARLGLDSQFQYSTLARALITKTARSKFADNQGLSVFGKNLIQFYVHEYFTVKYPRLPQEVLRHTIGLYTAVGALGKVGRNMGVEVDTRPALARYLADERDEDLLGKLVYESDTVAAEDGVIEVRDAENTVDANAAMASFLRALVAGIYAHEGLEKARQFIHNYIIRPHKVDMAALLAFEQPTRELAVLCAREGLDRPVSRLVAESGRYSKAPVFVVGVFSGDSKLGEGQGASLQEARTRAAVNALKAWYLYSPVDAQLPSDDANGYKPAHIDQGVVIV